MPIMDISVLPVGTGSPSLSTVVSACVAIISSSGLRYELTSMGTHVEGDLETLLKLAAQVHSEAFQHGIQRVVTTIKIDDRRDKDLRIDGKRRAVIDALKEKHEQ